MKVVCPFVKWQKTEVYLFALTSFGVLCFSRQFVMPGLVDTHIHAPQYPNAGKGLDVGLMEWLHKYTFPTESKFKDLRFADMAYRKAVVSIFMTV